MDSRSWKTCFLTLWNFIIVYYINKIASLIVTCSHIRIIYFGHFIPYLSHVFPPPFTPKAFIECFYFHVLQCYIFHIWGKKHDTFVSESELLCLTWWPLVLSLKRTIISFFYSGIKTPLCVYGKYYVSVQLLVN